MDCRNYHMILSISIMTMVFVLYALSNSHAINTISGLFGSDATMTGRHSMISYDSNPEVFELKSSEGEEEINLTPGLMKDLELCKRIVLNMNTTTYESFEYRKNILKSFVPPSEQFLADFKNPCWYANYTIPKKFKFLQIADRIKLPLSSDLELVKHVYMEIDSKSVRRLQCLPYFYLIGFSKCGTTALHHYIRQHPEYIDPCYKEPHYWSLYKIYNEQDRDTASLLYYLQCFGNASQMIQNSPRKCITGDTSSTVIWCRPPFVHHQENRIPCETPLLIESLQPGAKYIIAIRNPTEQVHSAFHYICHEKLKINLNSQAFHMFVEDSLKYWKSCVQKFSTMECLYNKQHDLKTPPCWSFISLIHPYIMVSIWLQVIPRERILIVKSEELRVNTVDVMRNLFKFLGLSPLTDDQLTKIATNRHINEQTVGKPPMLPSTRKLLQEFFKPFNEKLAHLLNDDRFLWKN